MNASSATVQGTTGHAIKVPFSSKTGMRAKNEKTAECTGASIMSHPLPWQVIVVYYVKVAFSSKTENHLRQFRILIMYYVKLKTYKGANYKINETIVG